MPFDYRETEKGYVKPPKINARRKDLVQPTRIVPAFTIQSNYQHNVKVRPPPPSGFLDERDVGHTLLRQWYNVMGLPIFLRQELSGYSLQWKVNIRDLDYKVYLPVFFDGLRELVHPFPFFAECGIRDMLDSSGEKALDVLSFVIPPIKKALLTHHPRVIINTMKAIQRLALCHDLMGAALIPHYHYFLPFFNLYIDKDLNIGDQIHYGQRKRNVMGILVKETLEIFEKTGGPQAYHQIKKFVPTYESCIYNH